MNKINVINVMLSSKNVLFSVVYAFLSKKIATFKKSYETGINKLFFSSEEKVFLKKEKVCVVAEHVHVGTSFWIMKSWILINQKTFECLKEVLKN